MDHVLNVNHGKYMINLGKIVMRLVEFRNIIMEFNVIVSIIMRRLMVSAFNAKIIKPTIWILSNVF